MDVGDRRRRVRRTGLRDTARGGDGDREDHPLREVWHLLARRRDEAQEHVVARCEVDGGLDGTTRQCGVRSADGLDPLGRRPIRLHRGLEILHRLTLVELDDREVMELLAVVDETEGGETGRDGLRRFERELLRVDRDDGHLERRVGARIAQIRRRHECGGTDEQQDGDCFQHVVTSGTGRGR
jgi:hypothetical protein